MISLARLGALCTMAVLVLGCHTTTIRSGRLPDARAAVYVEGMEVATFAGRWHHGFINGIVEAGGNYNLERICPNGWADITTERDFFSGLVSYVTYGVYSPQTVTIRCAAAGWPGYSPASSPDLVVPGTTPAPAAPPAP